MRKKDNQNSKAEQVDLAEQVDRAAEAGKKPEKKPEKRKKKKLRVVRSILSWVEWFLFLAVIGFCAYTFIMTSQGKAARLGGYSLLNIVTGSMEPTIYKDEYVIVKKADTSKLEFGDIIAYYSEAPDIKGRLVIHRIVEVQPDGTFILKGDANSTADKLPVRADQILGKYQRKAWFFNWLSSFMNPRKLILLLVIIPLLLVSIYETTSLAKLVHQAGKKKKKNEPEETREERVERLKKEAVEAYLREQGIAVPEKNEKSISKGASGEAIKKKTSSAGQSAEKNKALLEENTSKKKKKHKSSSEEDPAKKNEKTVPAETVEEKIARWKREGVEEYLAALEAQSKHKEALLDEIRRIANVEESDEEVAGPIATEERTVEHRPKKHEQKTHESKAEAQKEHQQKENYPKKSGHDQTDHDGKGNIHDKFRRMRVKHAKAVRKKLKHGEEKSEN